MQWHFCLLQQDRPAQETGIDVRHYPRTSGQRAFPHLQRMERKAFIQELRDKGIEDIPEYLVNNIDEYRRLLAGYNHIAYNNAILKLHDVENADEIRGYSLSARTSSTVHRDPEHQKDYIRQIP